MNVSGRESPKLPLQMEHGFTLRKSLRSHFGPIIGMINPPPYSVPMILSGHDSVAKKEMDAGHAIRRERIMAGQNYRERLDLGNPDRMHGNCRAPN